MKNRFTTVAGIATASALTIALAACGGGSGGGGAATPGANLEVSGDSYDGPKVELQLWNPFTGGDGPYFNSIVDEFNAANENVQIKVTSMDAADMYGKAPAAIRSNKGPDLAVFHVQSIPTQAVQGTLLGLDAIVADLGLTEDDFAQVVWQAGEVNGVRYSIPFDQHMLGLFYNKDLFEKAGLDPEKPPHTREEYDAALDALKAAGIQGHWQQPNAEWQFRGLIAQFGGSEFNEDGTEATFNSPAGVEALTWLRSLVEDGHSPANVDDAEKAFIAGTNAMGFFGEWFAGNEALDELNWGTAEFPVIGDQPAVWGSSHQLVITTQVEGDADRQAAAAYAVNQLSQMSATWANAYQVPARKTVRESAEVQAVTNLQPFIAQLDTVVFNPSVPGLENSLDPLNQAIVKVIGSGADPQQALDEAVELTNNILKDNAAKYGSGS
ncbi:MAG: ABC transporter substrate-binding protein [Salana multivorans]|uniref:ABC transporter substrate-binding protein n=1 Tax=Salana multivorans TaxID=120377 RepID=UPI0009686D89|nr:ABC transporter substrate-binding protein [Salana multivorans]MBN8883742.1 ABC transporter substrate-binding protein [Salana multivorans]OJX95394.1 MAG: hypothetical protein BGO96_11190 [Micrococcales bacterium 73-15]